MDLWFCCGAVTNGREGQKCVAAHPDSINARSPERAKKFCAFLLTWTYIDVGSPEITSVLPFRGYFRVGGHTSRNADEADDCYSGLPGPVSDIGQPAVSSTCNALWKSFGTCD